MKTPLVLALVLLAGCAHKKQAQNPPMPPGGPNWAEVDKSAQRVKEREQNKPRFVETKRVEEEGFLKMSDKDYADALEDAKLAVRKEHPDWSASDVEREATKRSDQARIRYESSYSKRSSSTYELKTP